MIAKFPGTLLVEGGWYEWIYPSANPFLELGGWTSGVASNHLILNDIHIFTMFGKPWPATVKGILKYKQEFMSDLLLLGYTSVTLTGKRVKPGKPSRPFVLTLP